MTELRGDLDWEAREWGSEWESDHRWYDESGHPIEYPVWDRTNTRVVSGPYGKNNFPGVRFFTRYDARAYWEQRAVIVEEYRVPGRWIFRVRERA